MHTLHHADEMQTIDAVEELNVVPRHRRSDGRLV